MKPLTKPTAAPTSEDDEQPHGGRQLEAEADAGGGQDHHAPIAGAKPAVDSSDRSNLPVMTISDSASTTSASAADEVRMVVRLARVRKTGLTKAPIEISDASAGSSARSRKRSSVGRAGGRRAGATAGRRRLAGLGRAHPCLRFLRSTRRARCRSSRPRARRRSRRGA